MTSIVDEIRMAVHGRHSLLYLQTPEENRVVEALGELASELGCGAKVSIWTCVDGVNSIQGADTRDPVAALRAIEASPHPGFYVMKDLTEFMGRAEVVRALRNVYHTFHATARTYVVILSPALVIPELLQKEVCLVEIPLPDTGELLTHVKSIEACYPGRRIPESMLSELALALRGLTLNEVGHLIHRVFGAGALSEKDILEQVFAEKKMLLRKAGYLEYVPTRIDVDSIGGLDVLKEWALKRKSLFTHEALKAGLPIPRGVLVMGISGCGKSLSAKAIATLWGVPLFRLDMNLVFSGIYGSPEAAFHRALRAIESVAPAVLWIDEVENALGMTVDSCTEAQSLTFSAFLTWMQERPPLVFVAATANRIESLPAEVIRKGRFDEVFFCDLPSEDERREIIGIHLRQNGADPDQIPVERLLYSTRGWSGAEIEQAIVAARIDAHRDGRAMNLEDIRHHVLRMVPLSTTMSEQIKAIRSWSLNRATRASKAEPKSMLPTAERA